MLCVLLSHAALCPVPRDRAEPYPEEFFARVIRVRAQIVMAPIG
jgi:hypothetical protein